MEQEKMQAFQQRLQELQQNISETDTTLDSKVTVTMNGKVEITEFTLVVGIITITTK